MKPGINTFIFDCFGVICTPVLNGWYKKHRLDQGFIDENIKKIFRKFDLNIFSEEDVLDYFSKYDGVNKPKEELRKEVDSFLDLNIELVNIIKKLKSKGFKIALLSNGNHSFFERKLYQIYPDFKSLFDEIIISSHIGMVKPDPEIYLHALEKVGAKPKEAIFVDDSKENVDGAEKLGIHGFIFSDTASFAEYLGKAGIDI